MKQYMPLKPVKRGIKVWECADVSNGYVWNLSVYTGKERDANPNKDLDTVLSTIKHGPWLAKTSMFLLTTSFLRLP